MHRAGRGVESQREGRSVAFDPIAWFLRARPVSFCGERRARITRPLRPLCSTLQWSPNRLLTSSESAAACPRCRGCIVREDKAQDVEAPFRVRHSEMDWGRIRANAAFLAVFGGGARVGRNFFASVS